MSLQLAALCRRLLRTNRKASVTGCLHQLVAETVQPIGSVVRCNVMTFAWLSCAVWNWITLDWDMVCTVLSCTALCRVLRPAAADRGLSGLPASAASAASMAAAGADNLEGKVCCAMLCSVPRCCAVPVWYSHAVS